MYLLLCFLKIMKYFNLVGFFQLLGLYLDKPETSNYTKT